MFWNMSFSVIPTMVMFRAIRSDQASRSFRVYPTTVGLPVVPDVVWMRTTFFNGTAKKPNGYPSRRSCFLVNGIFLISSSVFIDDVCYPGFSEAVFCKNRRSGPGLRVFFRRFTWSACKVSRFQGLDLLVPVHLLPLLCYCMTTVYMACDSVYTHRNYGVYAAGRVIKTMN